MSTFQFGTLPKVKVEVNEDGKVFIKNKLLGNTEIGANEIETLFIKRPSLMENGYIYISLDGVMAEKPVVERTGLVYTRKQEETAEEFISLLKNLNEDIHTTEATSTSTTTKKEKPVKPDRKAIKCPNCKSINVDFMGNNRKGFSVGKAVAGGVLTGGVGSIAGFAGKKGKNQWHCRDCGRTFKTKK